MPKRNRPVILAAMVAALAWSSAADAQRPPPQFPDMTFFLTSESGPDGANFGYYWCLPWRQAQNFLIFYGCPRDN